MDGPLKGLLHEVHKDWPCPAQMGFLSDDKKYKHWYAVTANQTEARFVKTVRVKDKHSQDTYR